MNKKILLVLVLVFSIFSIILIAVWGTLPENPSNIELETISIAEYDETNDDGDKFKNVTDIVTENDNIYIIEYTIFPDNANVDIQATTTAEGINIQVDSIERKIYVIYDLQSIANKRTITIQIKDKNTQFFDELTLWFKTPDVIIVPEI
ncbi:MAG: hypothetical protein CVV60_02960 [Tenericutes bacterium HGW-Tenericutes-5]|jgi:uncharacterized membrane protein|nr:MAG: hypothetical protein CVV60_02960 [Tenericutes bacterium HGW-Tenericutes-5]